MAEEPTFDLPPRSVFEPPSYPNVWFYVDERLARSHRDSVEFVTRWLADHCGLVDDFVRPKPHEGSDAQARLGGLQPWHGASDPSRNHAHDLHIRYYYVALRQTQRERAVMSPGPGGDARTCYRFAGSVHYEVEDEHPLHPYVDECPYCGRSGDYRERTDLFAGVHEPLGLELLLHGTIRGTPVSRGDGRPVKGMLGIRETHTVTVHEFLPTRSDVNVERLAVVQIGPKLAGAR